MAQDQGGELYKTAPPITSKKCQQLNQESAGS